MATLPLAKKLFLIALRYQLRTALAIGIEIKAVQWFIFSIPPRPFLIFINLIRGNIHKGFYAVTLSYTLQHICDSHNIGAICSYGIAITFQHNRLNRQVKNNLRLGFVKNLLQSSQISHIANNRIHTSFSA